MMIEYIIYAMTVLIDIVLIEFIIIMGKVIYEDFFKKEEENTITIPKELYEHLRTEHKEWTKL